jgi:hypothetical protein
LGPHATIWVLSCPKGAAATWALGALNVLPSGSGLEACWLSSCSPGCLPRLWVVLD